jgi:hypothetical protein
MRLAIAKALGKFENLGAESEISRLFVVDQLFADFNWLAVTNLNIRWRNCFWYLLAAC